LYNTPLSQYRLSIPAHQPEKSVMKRYNTNTTKDHRLFRMSMNQYALSTFIMNHRLAIDQVLFKMRSDVLKERPDMSRERPDKLTMIAELFKETTELFKETAELFMETTELFKETAEWSMETTELFKETAEWFMETTELSKETTEWFNVEVKMLNCINIKEYF